MVFSSDNSVPEVVISGIGGCFPQSESVEELKQKLLDQVDMIDDAIWKEEHSDICSKTGNILANDRFDSTFFKVHRKQSNVMDPMGRILLEKSYEAVIDAGINPMDIHGKNIAVYVCASLSDNESIITTNVESGFALMGQARALIANRISYYFNFTGPSLAADSSWLCGIQAISQGYNAIIAGEVEAAIVACCNLITCVQATHLFSKFEILNKDGKTKAFDENCDGYTRSDTACAFFIQRADLAKRNYATILKCDVEFNGNRSETLSDINVDCMSKFLTNFYKEANVEPKDVQYVETYGCGIKVLDEKELEVIDFVFNKDRQGPLGIGSVKSNVGHAEAASCMISIVKVIIAMETGIIPGTLNFETPNKNIPALVNGKIQVISKNKNWTPSLVAVNGIGIASSFGHILLKPNNRVKIERHLEIPMLHLLSTRTEEGIQDIIAEVNSNNVIDSEYSRLIHDVFSTTIPGHLYRGYVLNGKKITSQSMHFAGAARPIWFVYSGMGSQWITMGKNLLQLPIFAQSIEECHKILEPKGVDLKRIITDDDLNIFDSILNSFVGIAAIQIGLTDVLHSIGIVADGLIGHSVGELGCAYADGCLTAEQTILSAYYRGKASLKIKLIDGLMAAVGLGAEKMEKLCPPCIDIACHNSSTSCTLSGPKEEMQTLVSGLIEKGIFARLVNVANIPYHSRYIKPVAPLLSKYLTDIIPNPIARSPKWISTSVKESAWNTDLAKTVSSEYLTNNLLSSVYFDQGSKYIPNGALVIEIAPHGLLQAILKRSLPLDCTNVSLAKRGTEDAILYLFTALGSLFINGASMNLSSLYPTVVYPVSRDTKSLAPLVRWFHEDIWGVRPNITEVFSNNEESYAVNLNSEHFRQLVGHRVDNEIVIPITTYLSLVCILLKNNKERVDNVIFEDIIVKRHIIISEKDFVSPIYIMLKTTDFEISDRYGLILLGRVAMSKNYKTEEISSPLIKTENACHTFSKSNFQKELFYRGYTFNGVFNTVQLVNMYNEGLTAKIEWQNDWPSFVNAMLQVNILHEGEFEIKPIIPTFIRRLIINLAQLPSEHKDFDISYNYKTGILTSPIAQIKDVIFSPYIPKDVVLVADKYSFIKYSEDMQNLQIALNICLQIVQQSLKSDDSLYTINEIKDSAKNSFENYIYNYSEHHFASKIQLHILNDVSGFIPISSLTIIGEQHMQHINNFFKITEFILVCVPATQPILTDSSTSTIYSFISGQLQCHLLRQINHQMPVIINMKATYFNSSDLKNKCLPWVNQLQKSLNTLSKNQRIFLVSNVLPENGIEIFLKDIKTLQNGSNIRLMFLLDEHLPECNVSAKFYQEMFQKDLHTTVFKNGGWGNYFKTPYAKLSNEKAIEKNTMTTKDLRNMFCDYDVKYLSINAQKIIPNVNSEATNLGPVCFTGYDKSGQRVMGLTQANMKHLEMIVEPNFIWPVPEKWSFMQAASIPYAYACAYYVLFELAGLKPCDSILINNACSSLGEAAIHIASAYKCNIFTTVGSEAQRSTLLASLQMLSPHQVMLYTNTSLHISILQSTCGIGVNKVINCLSGKSLQMSMLGLSKKGRVVQVDLNNSDLTYTVGLNIFFSCSGLYGFIPKNIFEWSKNIKSKIHDFVSDGIKKNIVQPLISTDVKKIDLDPLLRNLKSNYATGNAVTDLNQELNSQVYSSNNFTKCLCKKNASYIIYGEDANMLLNSIRWLAANGAELIVVFTTSIQRNSSFIKRCKYLLEKQYNTEIVLEANCTEMVALSPKALHDIHNMKEIDAVLILNRGLSTQILEFMKQIDAQLIELSSMAHLICFWGQINMTYMRSNSLPVSNIKWDKSHDFSTIVKILEDIWNNPLEIEILSDQKSGSLSFSAKDYFTLLSKSQSSLISTVDAVTCTTELTQVVTGGARELKEATPSFIVPGLLGHKCKFLKCLLKKLLCPVYIINNGASDNLNTIAEAAVKQIKQKNRSYYNIIGISFGGALALEIVKLLEEQGEHTQLYLIDGVPETIQSKMNETGKKEWLETSLLSALLHINDAKDINSLRNISNWDTRIKTALQLGKHSIKESYKITKGLNIIKKKLNQVLNYKPSDKMITGTTRLLQPQDSNLDCSYGLTKCCKEITVEIIKGNHFTILESDQLAEYINVTVIIPPLYR